MRALPPRPTLSERAKREMQAASRIIADSDQPAAEAARVYANARRARRFREIVQHLAEIARPGSRCMYCSGGEAAEVEHYRPIATMPHHAMNWHNLLWSCGVCNRGKGDRFPLDENMLPLLLDPLTDRVWDHYFIDVFGLLTCRFQSDNPGRQARAATMELLQLDRETLRDSRNRRLRNLRQMANDSLARWRAKELVAEDLAARRREWLEQPFQPDVADYFLNGPGMTEPPFADFLAAGASGEGRG